MSVNVSDVKKLNERIEAIQRKSDRAKSQSEIFLAKLNKEIAEYEKKYNVKLSGANIDETMRLIEEESSRVSSAIEGEYNLKLKVVDAIDRGDIAEANKLLNVNDNRFTEAADVSEDAVDYDMQSNLVLEANKSYTSASSSNDNRNVSVDRKPADVKQEVQKSIKDKVTVTASRGIVIDEPEEPLKPARISVDANTMLLDDSDDSDEFDFGVTDSNDDDDEFGFGALLKGTKFGN